MTQSPRRLADLDHTDEPDYRLGGVLVDAVGRRLLLADHRERLPADTQQVEVLLCLIRSYPAIVSKDELLERVWGGRYVTDAALHKTVSSLRKLLREHNGGAELIETRYRRGYQLMQPAQVVSARPGGAAPAADDDSSGASDSPARPSPAPPPGQGRMLGTAWAAVLLATAVALWWPRTPDLVAPAPVVVEAAVAESLARMDDEALIQAIKDALVPDPRLARQAAAELRRRGESAPRLRGLADKFDGIVAYRAGDFGEAESAYLRALPAFREVGDRREEANVLNNLAVLLAEAGHDPGRAEALYREALAIRIELGDTNGVLGSHRNLSNLLLEAKRLEAAREAVAAYEQAAAAAGAAGDVVEARILRGDVMLASGEGDPRPVFESAMAMAQEAGIPHSAASASQRLGRLALRAGDPAAARAAFERTLTWYRESGATHQLDIVLYNLASAVAASGDVTGAIAHYEAVLAADPDGRATTLRVDTRLALARLHALAGHPDAARQSLAAAQSEALVLQNEAALAAVAIARADFALREGELIAARGHLSEAEQRLASVDDWELGAQWRLQDVWLRIAAGQPENARVALDRLRADARARRDLATEQRLAPLESALAGAAGDWAAAYRWQVEAKGVPVADADTPLAASSSRGDRYSLGLAGLLAGLLLGGGIGFWRARFHSKPSA